MTESKTILEQLNSAGVLEAIDIHFARYIIRRAGHAGESDNPALFAAAALTLRAVRAGHTCLDLRRLAGDVAFEKNGGSAVISFPIDGAIERAVRDATGVVATASDEVDSAAPAPLVIDGSGRLFLFKYLMFEKTIAGKIRELASVPETAAVEIPPQAVQYLQKDAAAKGADGPDWQKVAQMAAMSSGFAVITGGPGTGKTTTVARILALLVACGGHGVRRILLAAPTGKAAARMAEAINNAKKHSLQDIPSEVLDKIPDTAGTIHRMLCPDPARVTFRRGRDNPLEADVIVIDEASMIDAALMSRLLEAVPAGAKLILVGDKDQLSSVEAGSVFADICRDAGKVPNTVGFAEKCAAVTGCVIEHGADGAGSWLRDSIVVLTKNHRARCEGIKRLAAAVRAGDAAGAMGVLGGGSSDVVWIDPDGRDAGELLMALAAEGYDKYGNVVKNGVSPADVFAAFGGYRMLCATRGGEWGSDTANAVAGGILRDILRIPYADYFTGFPVMVTRNDAAFNLFNGDIGIVLPGNGGERGLDVCFMGVSGGAGAGPVWRRCALLPPHEAAFAMTIHKSQGSEFDEVCLLLPGHDMPILTRELIYTGITRARSRVTIVARESILASAIARPVMRDSSLGDMLWG